MAMRQTPHAQTAESPLIFLTPDVHVVMPDAAPYTRYALPCLREDITVHASGAARATDTDTLMPETAAAAHIDALRALSHAMITPAAGRYARVTGTALPWQRTRRRRAGAAQHHVLSPAWFSDYRVYDVDAAADMRRCLSPRLHDSTVRCR